MPRARNISGMRFGLLVVQKEHERRLCNEGPLQPSVFRIFWRCICDCGNETWGRVAYLTSGHKKSCGCLWYKDALPRGESELRARHRNYRYSASGRDLPWKLTDEQFRALTASRCHYCGSTPAYKKLRPRKGRWGAHFNGIDRLDSDGGYTELNCVACCSTCNRMKGTLAAPVFIQQCVAIANLAIRETKC